MFGRAIIVSEDAYLLGMWDAGKGFFSLFGVPKSKQKELNCKNSLRLLCRLRSDSLQLNIEWV